MGGQTQRRFLQGWSRWGVVARPTGRGPLCCCPTDQLGVRLLSAAPLTERIRATVELAKWCCFYAHGNREAFEPPHVHVRSANGAAAFWLEPVSLRDAQGYTRREADRVRRIVVSNRERLLKDWHDFFDPDA